MESNYSSGSHGTMFEFNSRKDLIRTTRGTQNIKQNPVSNEIGCSRDFFGTVEVDEPYLGGYWKTIRKTIRDQGTKRGGGTKIQRVFTDTLSHRYSLAEIVVDVNAGTLQQLLAEKVSGGFVICSDTLKSFTP
jgi:hypothetical protein